MKIFLIILVIISFNAVTHAQEVIEKLNSFNKKHNDFWTGKKSNILLEFQRTYDVDAVGDTMLRFYINVNNKEYETVGVSTNINIFNIGPRLVGGGGASATERVIKQKGTYILYRDDFEKLTESFNKVYSLVKSWQMKKLDNEHLVTYELNNEILVAGDYSNNGLGGMGVGFIIQFEEILFRLDELECIEISKYLRKVKETWGKMVGKH